MLHCGAVLVKDEGYRLAYVGIRLHRGGTRILVLGDDLVDRVGIGTVHRVADRLRNERCAEIAEVAALAHNESFKLRSVIGGQAYAGRTVAGIGIVNIEDDAAGIAVIVIVVIVIIIIIIIVGIIIIIVIVVIIGNA